MPDREIRIENARSHNLQGVTCRIPLGALTVITGVSGSGKSTLAFDTLYAEGQRRYVTSLSTYARQFLERLPRPAVDSISNLPPAIAIEQRNRVTNARSTVGTATEILDHLRLLFAKAGETRCPDCDRAVEPGTVEAVAERLLRRFAGARVTLAAPLLRRRGAKGRIETAGELRDRLAREGFTRLLDAEGRVVDVTELRVKDLAALRPDALLVIDRLQLPPEEPQPSEGGPPQSMSRLTEAVAAAFARGDGRLVVVEAVDGARAEFREGFACDGCQRVFPTPEPALFSFNSPLGACQTCQGFGRVPGLDLERIVPDPERSLVDHAIAPFATRMGRAMQRDLLRACRRLGIPEDAPFRALSDEQRALVVDGEDEEDGNGDWYGVRGFFEWLEGRRYKVQARVLIARYRRFDPCPDCQGARLRPEALCVWLAGRNLGQLSRLTLTELRDWLRDLELEPHRAELAQRVLPVLRARVDTVDRVGLGYLGLDRQVRTLSGGEAQRIQLGTALGGSLTASLYVLDEPSIGLHARDVDQLLAVLRAIRDHGNTVVVVEHAPEVVLAADHIIDLGPRAGRDGGRLVFEGDVAGLRADPDSLTGRALRDGASLPEGRVRRAPKGMLRVVGASANNLRDLTVEFPLGCLTVVTGVSGAGKSTLVSSVLVGHLRRDPERGACKGIEGGGRISEVVVVDQTPPTRSPRSNPATVSKAFDGVRRLFAATREAKALGVGPGWFSFNVPGGRCDSCDGSGEVVIDMQFLDDVRVPCDECGGRRYRPEVLDVRLGGRSIVDVLELTIADALEVFANERGIAEKLRPFSRVGLGYLRLGQPVSTLSGGEHQRLRLALALGEGAADVLYVLDEPTTGLHPFDIRVLLSCLDELVEAGGSVLVVEHNLDVVRQADWVIDLGPEGGPSGGQIVAVGTPEELARVAASHTGAALRAAL
ncbi:MAG: excinuclease ABC subunit UvrA [Proteobacteria bacterium]|nr:excinuclease ABC subunit UvrA [Pseudomonadota bacterium]